VTANRYVSAADAAVAKVAAMNAVANASLRRNMENPSNIFTEFLGSERRGSDSYSDVSRS
jgi:hypothetical protein